MTTGTPEEHLKNSTNLMTNEPLPITDPIILSEDSGIEKFPKLSDSNCSVWAMQMEAQLIQKGLFTNIIEIVIDITGKDGVAWPQEEIDKEIDKKMMACSAMKMAEAHVEMILCVEPG
ncbi:hypothetical protein BT96DRAFT_1004201 [Gymnopus androsaceus JB14]|uniref:DUF4219 domain-containing protein n=1 Tax=Gymnopus androsaceus JB14 TaxID=1447944 RepID=A0A6A4GRX2_9AGAR|nr:hypothetical protein BT96DRAFT_1004201 [Gymnopus androsaceus JB14]